VKLQTIVAQSLDFSVFLKPVCSQLIKTAGSNAQLLARSVSARNCTTKGKLGHPCLSGVWNTMAVFERYKTVHSLDRAASVIDSLYVFTSS
jgi:hypothetical protein